MATIAAAFALVAGLIAEWSKSFDLGVVTPLIGTNQSVSDVAAIAEINTNRARTQERIAIQITFCNRSRDAVALLHIAKVMCPGFDFEGELSDANAALITPMQPGERRTATLAMRPVNTSGQYTVAIRYAWQHGSRNSQATVNVGPLIVTSPARAHVTRIGGPILSLFKDLALPIVLAIAAWYLQRREKKGEARKKAEEDERFHHRTTWNLMLPVSHEYNTRYYLPLLRAISQLKTSLVKREPARDALFALLQVRRKFRYITDHIGGLFLKDTDAEQLVVDFWTFVFRQLTTRLDATDSERVLVAMTPREDRAVFKDRFPAPGAVPTALQESLLRLEAAFSEWLQTTFESDVMPSLRIVDVLLRYEINRPFAIWYDGPIVFPEVALRENDQLLKPYEFEECEVEPRKVSAVDEWRLGIPAVRRALHLYIERRSESPQPV